MNTPEFFPHPLLAHPQAQTAFAAFVAKPVKLQKTERLWVELDDGDALLLNQESPVSEDPSKPIVLLLHGLGGSGDGSLIVRQSAKLNQFGYIALRLNHRGCGTNAQHRAKQIYHSGRTADIAATLKFIAQRWPGRSVLAVAYSLSGNMLLKLLGVANTAELHNLKAALAVCPPIDLEQCSLALSAPHNRHIDRFFSFMVTRQARQRQKVHQHQPSRTLPYGLTLREFDANYTAPEAGFASRDDYYQQCSSVSVLNNITTPTMILAAGDDPIIPSAIFRSAVPSHLELRVEKFGGHMGFYAANNTSYGDKRWLDAYVLDWVKSRI